MNLSKNGAHTLTVSPRRHLWIGSWLYTKRYQSQWHKNISYIVPVSYFVIFRWWPHPSDAYRVNDL